MVVRSTDEHWHIARAAFPDRKRGVYLYSAYHTWYSDTKHPRANTPPAHAPPASRRRRRGARAATRAPPRALGRLAAAQQLCPWRGPGGGCASDAQSPRPGPDPDLYRPPCVCGSSAPRWEPRPPCMGGSRPPPPLSPTGTTCDTAQLGPKRHARHASTAPCSGACGAAGV